MNETHQKILNAIIEKAKKLCPDSLALIGLYGSNATGDVHQKSDLDLMILINDMQGYKLSDTFILDDTDIGYDLYCTTWKMLESDAECPHAYLAKLLDSQILYVKENASVSRLMNLRERAKSILSSEKRYEKANASFSRAKQAFADCMLVDDLSNARTYASAVITESLNALMLFYGTYFKKGAKRTFEELSALNLPFDIKCLVIDIISSETQKELCSSLEKMLKAVKRLLTAPKKKDAPCHKNLAGSYEEIYSNWRNKMQEASLNNDLYSSFMNLASFDFMLKDIAENTDIKIPDVMHGFDPCNLQINVTLFENALAQYEKEYEKAGIEVKHFNDIDDFLASYLH